MGTKNIKGNLYNLIQVMLLFPFSYQKPDGLEVKIAASYPAGPGSNPGKGYFVFLAIFKVFCNFLGLVSVLG